MVNVCGKVVGERQEQLINQVLFYVCLHQGDIRQQQQQQKSIILTYPQDYVQSI